MNFYVISYDISDTKTRNKVAKILEGYGTRIQYSVFECYMSREKFNVLYSRLVETIIDTKNDSIRIYSLCKECNKKKVTIGMLKGKAAKGDEIIVV